jgi:hypothetical protein
VKNIALIASKKKISGITIVKIMGKPFALNVDMEANEMSYTIIVITDGKESWKKDYENCVDAVNAYNKFTDYGFAKLETLITLIEPDMKIHTKIFRAPTVINADLTTTKG